MQRRGKRHVRLHPGELALTQQEQPRLLGLRPSHGAHCTEAHEGCLRRVAAVGFASEFEAALRPVGLLKRVLEAVPYSTKFENNGDLCHF
jgi:hypothetical protein